MMADTINMIGAMKMMEGMMADLMRMNGDMNEHDGRHLEHNWGHKF